MNLQEQVAKLQEALPKLKSSDQNFAISLIASFRKYKKLTPNQEPWIGKLLERTQAPVLAVPGVPAGAASVASVQVGSFEGVIALFAKAKAAGLKFPKITLLCLDKPITLAVAGAKSKNPGSVSIVGEGKYPHRAFYGTVSPEGVLAPWHKTTPEFVEALTALLTKLAAQPARVAKEHGKLTGNCCFCNKKLGEGEDKRSIAVGFGPVCAERYGLKTEWKLGVAKVELVAGYKASEVIVDDVTYLQPVVVDSVTAVGEAVAAGAAVAIKCFFCEESSTETKIMHGYTVCPTCAKQLQ